MIEMAGYRDELQQALKENSIRGVWHGVGEGNSERGHFRLKKGHLEAFDPEKEKPISNAPIIITDEMSPIEYMGNDKREMFTSMSRYKRRVKEDGYEITGGDHFSKEGYRPPKPTQEEIREDAIKAYYDIKYDRVRFTEKEKQDFIESDRKLDSYKKRIKL